MDCTRQAEIFEAETFQTDHGLILYCLRRYNVNNGPNDAEYPEVEGVAKVYNGIGIPLHCHSKVNHRYPILILVQRDSFWERVGVSFLDSWQAGQSLIKLEKRKIRLG
jgi:hypothetical protein